MAAISSIDDFFDEERESRNWALLFSTLTSSVGLVVGPVVASQIAVALNW